MKLKAILSILGLMILIFGSSKAMATNYECDTTQINEWHGGYLNSDSAQLTKLEGHVILFNDHAGDGWITKRGYIYKYDKSLFDPLPLKIIQRPESSNKWLLAVFNGAQGSPYAGSSFRMSSIGSGSNMKIFVFYSTAMEALLTGECRVHNEEIPTIKFGQVSKRPAHPRQRSG